GALSRRSCKLRLSSCNSAFFCSCAIIFAYCWLGTIWRFFLRFRLRGLFRSIFRRCFIRLRFLVSWASRSLLFAFCICSFAVLFAEGFLLRFCVLRGLWSVLQHRQLFALKHRCFWRF